MRGFRRNVAASTCLLLCLIPLCAEAGVDFLENGFREPPVEARTRCYWWWLNGNVTKEAITRDLEEMRAKGYGGALIFDADGSEQRGNQRAPAGPLFGSPAWRELFRHAVQEAARLGLELSLSIQSGWNLGGPDVTPEESAKQLAWSETVLHGPRTVRETLPVPEHRAGYYRDICVLSYPRKAAGARSEPIRDLDKKAAFHELGGSAPDCRPLLDDVPAVPGEEDARAGQVVELSDRFSREGILDWDVPEGDWTVLRFGYTVTGAQVSTSSGDWQGLVIDYMSTEILRAYWGRHVAPLLDEIGPLAGTTLKYLHTDSWECGGMNWTPGFAAQFERRRGYDPLPWLPVIAGRIIESRDASNRFLADFRRTIADNVAEQHYAVFAALARERGLGVHPESGGPHAGPFDALQCLGRSDVPMSEYWVPSPHRPTPDRRFFVKQAACAAHIYGKRVVAAEGFTSIGPHWNDILWQGAKPSFDHEACAGLNLTFIHTFTCSPAEMGLPGQEYFAGTHFNPNVTWWDKAGAVIGYLNRCQFLLQQGEFVADVCCYYGDHVPNLVRMKEDDPAGAMPGFDYDVINEEVLCSGLEVRDGRIVLPCGMEYRLLALPDHRVLSLAATRAAHALVRAGATVCGFKPERTASLAAYPDCEPERRALVEELWGAGEGETGEHACGPGRVVWGKSARTVLIEAGIAPDCAFAETAPGDFDYIHRRTGDTDIYFVANLRDREAVTRATFRVTGKLPEIWDPLDAAIRDAGAFRQADGSTTLPLAFAPYGSCFIVFRRPTLEDTQGNAERNFPSYAPIAAIDGPWTVHFDPEWGAPESVVFDQLVSWTERPEAGIRFYSGAATYEKILHIAPEMLENGARLSIDLGDFRHMAAVRLNGVDLGVVWAPPFRVDIASAAKPGEYALEIEVVNNWTNRLVGDAALPAGQRRTWTNIQQVTAATPLAPSGLFGPVRLLRVQNQ